ncbi:phage tail protein [Paenibacillus sp. UMB7766-LJ446]|uniref:phage tail protein n=1 Tax=Paenibacillus sp. UMB7766-LJ446 TaxID=3046313 RepID=UPI00254A7BCD|nr:phage tail protein [Paenibacillus sp. UMB7766-LJ446]MDK8191540.1 phage tail protein [Paenibacillus sp. UMB7766-LJ446]
MPQETDRLKLPLPLGNENVTRESINGIFEKIDAGVATQADLDTLREAVSKMDIPDASLTQKGKVQLSSKTDSSSETVAATEKAVSDARVAASTLGTANAKIYTDSQVNQISKSLNLFSGAVRSSGNIFVCAFNSTPTVSNGFSFKVQFNVTNSTLNTATLLQINGTNYHLRAEHFKNYTLPNNYIDPTVVYEVIYLSSISAFVMNEVSRDADLRGGEVIVRVGKNTSTAQFSTIQDAVDFLKKFNAGVRTIKIENSTTSSVETYTGDVSIQDFHGAPLYFSFDPRIRLVGYFNIGACSAEVLINGNYQVPLEIVNSNNSFFIQNCNKIRLMYVNKTSTGYSFMKAIRVPVLDVSDCNISNQMEAFDISEGTVAYFNNIKGSNNTYGGRVGSSILMRSSYSVSSSNATTSSGSLILGN